MNETLPLFPIVVVVVVALLTISLGFISFLFAVHPIANDMPASQAEKWQ